MTRRFVDQEVRLHELLDKPHGWTVSDARFEKCTIIGPAIVWCADVDINHSQIMGDETSVLWPIVGKPAGPNGQPRLIGTIQLQHCVFDTCTFQHIGFAHLPEHRESVKAALGIE